MDITQILTYLAIGGASGAGLFFTVQKLVEKSIINEAKEEAGEITKEAEDSFQADEAERAERIQEIELELWGKVEEAHLSIEEKCTELEERIQSKKKGYEESDKLNRQTLMNTENDLRLLSMQLADVQNQFQTVKKELEDKKEIYTTDLQTKTSLTSQDVIGMIKDRFIAEYQADAEKYIEQVDIELKDFAEAKAKRVLSLCIERFSKEMSTERHISSTYFPNEKIRALFCQNLDENVKVLQDITGCDIFIDAVPEPERLFNVQVVGYDPVRRELARRIFDKIFRDTEKSNKPTDPTYIKRVAESIKTELVRQIKKDGDLLAKELGF
ncbi:MAG: DUF3552 domain-containing protein, partial [Bdellovibrionaceae bacterium]|nr:DUF3552 domain-containing protein [Pseudobdellovibrionaceae bacterium]